jgi:hypothetical protein
MENVRMGEMIVSARRGDELAVIGLDSCIGLCLIDVGAEVIGLAHVVLPDVQGAAGPAGKFGDLVVPALLRMLARAGVNRRAPAAGSPGRRRADGRAGLDRRHRGPQRDRRAGRAEERRDPRPQRGHRRQPRLYRPGHGWSHDHLAARRGERRTLLDVGSPAAVTAQRLGKPGLAGAKL